MTLLRRTLGFIRPYRWYFAAAQAAMLTAAAMGVVLPLISRSLIDSIGSGTFQTQSYRLLVMLAGSFLITAVANYFKDINFGTLSQFVVRDIRERTFGKITDLHLSTIEQEGSGNLISIMTNDINLLQESATQGVAFVITQILSLLVILVILFLIDPVLTGILALVTPVLILVTRLISGRVKRQSVAIQRQLGVVTGILSETVRGIGVIKSFVLRSHALSLFRVENEKVVSGSIRVARLRGVNGFLNTMVAGSVLVILVGVGSYRAGLGEISVGDLVAFLIYAQMIVTPVGMLSGLAVDIRKAMAAAERIFRILDLATESSGSASPEHACIEGADIKGERGDVLVADDVPTDAVGRIESTFPITHSLTRYHRPVIRLDSCGFIYGDGTRALDGIDLTIEAGSSLGIVGPSGAGKSTLLDLMMRFRDPTEGSIRIDGVNIDEIEIEELRSLVGAVLQDTHLFDMSVRDNILCGNPMSHESDVIEAAKAANAHEFIRRLPNGYDTVLGEDGYRLSGGQRQRLAMARAFLRDAPILLLDEATSALDTESERKIRDALDRLSQGRTTIAVAHRISTVQNMDSIMVLDQGRMVANGSHDRLLSECPLYSELCRSQMLRAAG